MVFEAKVCWEIVDLVKLYLPNHTSLIKASLQLDESKYNLKKEKDEYQIDGNRIVMINYIKAY